MAPGVQVTDTGPSQLSVAVTAGSQAGGLLQPRYPPVGRLASTGAVTSTFQVQVTVAETGLPHWSKAEYTKDCDLLHRGPVIFPGVQVTDTGPSQLSVAVTAGSQAGGLLQPRYPPVGRLANTGGMRSCFQVQVTVAETGLPHWSTAEYTKDCDLLHSGPVMAPGVQVTDTGPSQLSVAVTAGSQAGGLLQPRYPPVGRLASTGAVTSTFQVQVTVAETGLLHWSTAE